MWKKYFNESRCCKPGANILAWMIFCSLSCRSLSCQPLLQVPAEILETSCACILPVAAEPSCREGVLRPALSVPWGVVTDGSGCWARCSCGGQQNLLSVIGIIGEDETWPWGPSLWVVESECGMGKEELRYVFAGCSGWYNGEHFHWC